MTQSPESMSRPFLNFHAHRPAASSAETVIRNYVFPQEQPEETTPSGHPFSIGIHPWHIPHDIGTAWEELERQAASPGCIAIGEAGIDKNTDTPVSRQAELLLRHAELASARHLPLVIHCVKAWNELIALKKGFPHNLPCVIHGFRGKPQLAESLLAQGFHLSFGFRFNPQCLRLCPAGRIFLETDEDPRSVEELYRTAASLRGCTPENLRAQCLDNLARIAQPSKK